jgi:hypothetical protein
MYLLTSFREIFLKFILLLAPSSPICLEDYSG